MRGVNTIGGVTKDISNEHQAHLTQELDRIEKEFRGMMSVVDKSLIIANRLSGTGTLSMHVAKDLGAVGVVAKGSGLAIDSRKEFPYAAYPHLDFALATETGGDVSARFRVRVLEIYSTISLIRQALVALPEGPVTAGKEAVLPPNAYAVSVAEGWRGDIVYTVATDAQGDVSRVHVRDASFLNWPLFIQFAPGNVVLDFPLMNKSCNLSYSGNDK